MPKMADLKKMLEQPTTDGDVLSTQDRIAVEIIEKMTAGLRAELGFSHDDRGFERKHSPSDPAPEETVITPHIVRHLDKYLFGVEATQDGIRLDMDLHLTTAFVPVDKKIVAGWAVLHDGRLMHEMAGAQPSDESISTACVAITKAAVANGAVKKVGDPLLGEQTDWRNTGRGFR